MLKAMVDTTPSAYYDVNNWNRSENDGSEPLEELSIGTFLLKGFFMGLIIVGAVLGNALVIISVIRHRKLRIITNYYVVSLAMADLLVALCVMTFNASVSLTGRWIFGRTMCDVWNSLDVYFCTASILHLCCISVDRYYAIVRPLQYPITMTHRTVFFMLANVWLLPALISFTPIFLGWYTTAKHEKWREFHPDECQFVVNEYYAIISSSISFWIPGVVMVSMYCRIYKEAVRQREALSRTSSNIILNSIHQHRRAHPHYVPRLLPMTVDGDVSPATLSSDHDSRHSSATSTTPVPIKSSQISSNGNARWYGVARCSQDVDPTDFPIRIDSSPRKEHVQFVETEEENLPGGKRPSQTPLTKGSVRSASSWRTEHKAARTLGIIMGVFMICWLPFFLWYVITTLCGDACPCPEIVVSFLFWIGYFNSALNPLIYAYFNRDFREAFKNTLQCVFPCCFTCCPKSDSPVQYV